MHITDGSGTCGISRAFILGAGLGTRLRPLTGMLPKPLIPFFHEPLVLHAMRRCHECGIREFIINTHHLADAWDRVFPERSWNGCPVHFSHEAVLLDSGGGVKKIEPWAAADEPLLVMNGDTAATFDLRRVIAAHMERRPAVTLALRTDGDKRNVGFDASSGLVTDMRHALGRDLGTCQFTGAYCMEPEVFGRIPADEAVSIIPVFLDYIREGRLHGILADDGLWMDMGTPGILPSGPFGLFLPPSAHSSGSGNLPRVFRGLRLRDRPRCHCGGRLPAEWLHRLARGAGACGNPRGTPHFLSFPLIDPMKNILRLLALLLCVSGLVHAEHRVFTKKDGFLSMRDKLNVYFFRSDTHRLLVRDEGSVQTPRYGSLDKAMRRSPCVAGVNGGFFGADAAGTPLGLVVQDGKRLFPLASGAPLPCPGSFTPGAKTAWSWCAAPSLNG